MEPREVPAADADNITIVCFKWITAPIQVGIWKCFFLCLKYFFCIGYSFIFLHSGEKPEVELYPIQLRLLRHQAPAAGANAIVGRSGGGVTTANSPYGGSASGTTTFGIWGAAAGMAVSAVTSTASSMTNYHDGGGSGVVTQAPKR